MRPIDADELKRVILRSFPPVAYDQALVVCDIIDMMPTIDPAKRGRWVKAEKGGEWWYACSICEGHIPKTLWGQDWHSSYCPNCGALMREGGEEDE